MKTTLKKDRTKVNLFGNALPWALSCALMLFSQAKLQAADYTWTGNGDDYNWSTVGNWNPSSLPGAIGNVFLFSGTSRLAPVNDRITQTAGITFLENAGAFVLSGNALTLGGRLTNNSRSLQTINNAIAISPGQTINTGTAGITLGGAISGGGGLTKAGAGTLTLTGNTTSYSGGLVLGSGKITLNAVGGAAMHGGQTFVFGTSNSVNSDGQGGIFEFIGSASGVSTVTFGASGFNSSSGANQVILKSNGGDGANLLFNGLWNRNVAAGAPTLNFNLASAANSHVYINSFAANTPSKPIVNTNLLPYITVTDRDTVEGVEGVRTGLGLAMPDPTNGYEIKLLKYDDMTDLFSTGAGNGEVNYRTSGNHNLASLGSAASLTIMASGTMTGSVLRTNAIMMGEGVGDYVFNNQSVGYIGASLVINQYSTDGTLTINGDILETNGPGAWSDVSLAKTGPGTVIFNGNANALIGLADIQGGLFQLDGSFAGTKSVIVHAGATLAGKGFIGSGNTGKTGNGITRYTPVNILSDATLDAAHSTANALKITGKLTLYAGSNYKVDLQDTTNDFNALTIIKDPAATDNAVTLAGNLVLTLGYALTEGETFDLLTMSLTDGSYGRFDTINGSAFGPNDTFSLSHDSVDYQFVINYGLNSVSITNIPEPGTMGLLASAAAAGFCLYRRRTN